MQEEIKKEKGFLGKVMTGILKIPKGFINFFKKTAIRNSANYYGRVKGHIKDTDQLGSIAELAVYDDHALLFSIGVDDVTFTKKNVIVSTFEGTGENIDKRATVEYGIVLADTVVFPEKIRQRFDVKELVATVKIEKDRSHFLGTADLSIRYCKSGRTELWKKCDVYRYDLSFVFVKKGEGDVEDETWEIPFQWLSALTGKENNSVVAKFVCEDTAEIVLESTNKEVCEFFMKPLAEE